MPEQCFFISRLPEVMEHNVALNSFNSNLFNSIQWMLGAECCVRHWEYSDNNKKKMVIWKVCALCRCVEISSIRHNPGWYKGQSMVWFLPFSLKARKAFLQS